MCYQLERAMCQPGLLSLQTAAGSLMDCTRPIHLWGGPMAPGEACSQDSPALLNTAQQKRALPTTDRWILLISGKVLMSYMIWFATFSSFPSREHRQGVSKAAPHMQHRPEIWVRPEVFSCSQQQHKHSQNPGTIPV